MVRSDGWLFAFHIKRPQTHKFNLHIFRNLKSFFLCCHRGDSMVQHVALVSACVKKSNLSVVRILSLVLCEIQQVRTLLTWRHCLQRPDCWVCMRLSPAARKKVERPTNSGNWYFVTFLCHARARRRPFHGRTFLDEPFLQKQTLESSASFCFDLWSRKRH